MSVTVSVTVIKPIDNKGIKNFMEKTVRNSASVTLNMTTGRFPRRTGKLEAGSYALGVKGSGTTYTLGTTARYGKYVWGMSGVRWTNPSTLPQWYYRVFKNNKEMIISQAVRNAK